MKKREPQFKPEEQDAHERMGTVGVLADLKKKYGLPDDNEDNAVEESTYDKDYREKTGAPSVMEQLRARHDRMLQKLEGIPTHTETIPKQELQSVVDARLVYREMVDTANVQVESLLEEFSGTKDAFNEARRLVYREALQKIEAYLDTVEVFVSKFSTQSEDYGYGGRELRSNPVLDSVYYVTESGISLRLKKSAIEDDDYAKDLDKRGLNLAVSQPAERIVFSKFEDGEKEMSLTPILGHTVKEYFPKSFDDVVKEGTVSEDFNSELVVYQDDSGKVHEVLPGSQDTAIHDGDRVNKIY